MERNYAANNCGTVQESTAEFKGNTPWHECRNRFNGGGGGIAAFAALEACPSKLFTFLEFGCENTGNRLILQTANSLDLDLLTDLPPLLFL